ncbi:hypothetical protein NGA_0497600, partial [Nannochloropsis gaditana CCMP526]|uniref:uncharacterized protein n=1 Tax=Nannochloropsis gaditana (strain CCMP526) TaxID=1093141 RepID=UPI00029F5438
FLIHRFPAVLLHCDPGQGKTPLHFLCEGGREGGREGGGEEREAALALALREGIEALWIRDKEGRTPQELAEEPSVSLVLYTAGIQYQTLQAQLGWEGKREGGSKEGREGGREGGKKGAEDSRFCQRSVVVLGDDAAGGKERMEEEEREKRESGRGVREEEGRALLLILRGSSLPLLTPGIAYLRSLLLPPGACAPSASSDCITHDIVLLPPSCPSSPRLETSGGGRERDLQSP